MIHKKLRLINFMAYKDETIDFENYPSLFAVIGENGVGKSSIIEAITIVLFNQGRSATSSSGNGLENLIHKNSDFFQIEYTFEMDGIEYKVVRKRKKSGQELQLFVNGVDHTEKIKETQAKVDAIVKTDYDTFLDSVCIGQGKSSSFMDKKPNDRKEVFMKIFRLEEYEILEKEAKDQRKILDTKLDYIDSELNEIHEKVNNRQIFENEILNLENQVSIDEFEIIDLEKQLEIEVTRKAQHEQVKKQSDHIINTRSRLQDQITKVKDSIPKGEIMLETLKSKITDKSDLESEISIRENKLENISQEIIENVSKLSELKAKNKNFQEQVKDIKLKHSRLENFNEVICGQCLQEVNLDNKSKHLNEMKQQGLDLLKKIKYNESLIEDLDSNLNKLKSTESQLKIEIVGFKNKINDIISAEAKIPGVEEKLKNLCEQLLTLESDLAENMKIQVSKIENEYFCDSEIRQKLSQLRSKISSYQMQIGSKKNTLESIKKDEEKIGKLHKEQKSLQKDIALYEELIKAYSKNGIPAAIIENSLEGVEEEINKVLSILTNDRINIEFRTQKTNKSKGVIETLDIIVTDENGSRIYETYSGGEKFRIDFSCHVGLAKFLAKRANSAIKFFIIDEGIGSLDDSGKSAFIQSVNKCTEFFEQIMVITHIEDIKESFDHKLLIYKDPIKGSQAKLIS